MAIDNEFVTGTSPLASLAKKEELLDICDILDQLVGGVDVQTQHRSSDPHESEFRFLFILEVQSFLRLM
jgi:hypothetical protein